MRQRREDDGADAQFFQRIDETILLDPAVDHRIARLVDDAGRAEVLQDGGGLTGALRVVGRDADIKRLARAHDLVQRATGFLKRRVGVETVGIEDIDVIQTHALQALVAGGDYVFAAAPFAIGAGPHVVTGLGGDDHLVAITSEIRLQDFTEGGFGAAGRRAVIIGEIEMGDAEIEGAAADGLFRLVRCVVAEIVPEAERNRRQFQAGLAAMIIFHGRVSVFGRLPNHGSSSTC
ncbi:hypothetical protein D3C78_869040 [compost metagenome]